MNVRKIKKHLPIVLLLFLFLSIVPSAKVYAADATAVSFGKIDYENLTMQIYNNSNSIVYYSTDNTTWAIVEGSYDTALKVYSMDISWVDSTNDVTLYIKGDTIKTVKSITLPAQNSSFNVTYDKVEGEFTFSDVDEADTFMWRKSSDYYWTTVKFDESTSSYHTFQNTMENLRVKGAKIIFRTPQEIGTGNTSVGYRSSKEVTISITALAAAPIVKVNSLKLSLSATTAMEYYDSSTSLWIDCDKSMLLADIAPSVLYENGAKKVTLLIRKTATSSTPNSKTQSLTIPAQTAAPTIGDNSSDVTHYYLNSKLVMYFNRASSSNIYQYTIVKSGDDLDVSTAIWSSVTNAKLITLTTSKAPDGCSVYVRKKGIDANATKNIDLVLSSATAGFSVKY